MQRAIWIYTVVHLTVIGVSHIAAPHAWARFFILLRERGTAGVLVVGAMSLTFGAPIVAFHNVWSGWPLVVTLIGWAQLVKAAIYLIFPAYGLRQLQRVSEERARMFVPAGLALLVLTAPAWYLLLRAPAG